MRTLANLQLATRNSYNAEIRYSEEIAYRIANGAEVEDCEYRWDAENRMVRTRKEKAG